jgi:hypothetical protein
MPPAPPAVGVGSNILLRRLLQSLPSAREQPNADRARCAEHSETSFEGLVDTDRADRRHAIFRQGIRVRTPASKRSGLLLTSDRYVCKAAEIQGTGSRRREVENTRLEVRASIINRDYD